MSASFYPRLLAVRALSPFKVETDWSTGETLKVDLQFALHSSPALRKILRPEVFPTVHLCEWGHGLEWFDSELAADNVYAWAKEQAGEVSHQMLDAWMHRNHLSLTTAADALGISRRMVSYYRTAQKSIPRAVWLACLGWELTRPAKNELPRGLPTVAEYARMRA